MCGSTAFRWGRQDNFTSWTVAAAHEWCPANVRRGNGHSRHRGTARAPAYIVRIKQGPLSISEQLSGDLPLGGLRREPQLLCAGRRLWHPVERCAERGPRRSLVRRSSERGVPRQRAGRGSAAGACWRHGAGHGYGLRRRRRLRGAHGAAGGGGRAQPPRRAFDASRRADYQVEARVQAREAWLGLGPLLHRRGHAKDLAGWGSGPNSRRLRSTRRPRVSKLLGPANRLGNGALVGGVSLRVIDRRRSRRARPARRPAWIPGPRVPE
jgi:hypothetical protein